MDKESKLLAQLTAGKILFAIVLVTITWIVLRWMRGFLKRLEGHNPRLRFLIRQIEPPFRIMVWFAALLFAADIIAPSRDAFVAAIGSAALAIGLGLQDLIKNLIGGMVIIADRPYQTGDRVKLGDAYGEVVQIGLRSTKILSSDGVLATVPSSEALTRVTFNANAGVAECMVKSDVALPRAVDADEAIRIGREVAVSCPYAHLGRGIEVELDDTRLSYFVKLSISAHVYDHRYESAMQTDMLRRAKREFAARGLLKGAESRAEKPG
ncbi:MAG: mechanosensitive ion channel [Acidobacteriaceae bacterium]|nr:mechanosensitive ion channel [Acidobacteriaceae bacterium]